MLLEKHADPKARLKNQMTVLHYAALSGSEAVVKLLLGQGVELDARNQNQWTALRDAVHSGSEAVIFDYCGMSAAQYTRLHSLPKLETGLSSNPSGGLRTAPPYGRFGVESGTHNYGFGTSSGNFINSYALHLNSCTSLLRKGAAGYRMDEIGK